MTFEQKLKADDGTGLGNIRETRREEWARNREAGTGQRFQEQQGSQRGGVGDGGARGGVS